MPESCSACGTAIPVGSERCPGCGRVFGEANRCPRCHAVAATERTPDGFVCAACGAPRDVLPGTVVRESTTLSLAPGATAHVRSLASRGAALVLRLLGGGVFGAGTLAVLGTVVFGRGTIGAPALVETLITLVAGGSLFALGRIVDRRAHAHAEAGLELRILDLAARSGGELYATDVARALGIATADAEAALSRLADGTRVTVEVTDDGLLKYLFRELSARASEPRVRVAAPEVEEELAVDARETGERERER